VGTNKIRNAETLYLTNRDDWREWLEKNHDTKKEVWLIFYKTHTSKPTIPYEDDRLKSADGKRHDVSTTINALKLLKLYWEW
jgi:hypothetical protein